MATTKVYKSSAKSNLDIAKAIDNLQDQVNENAKAIKQALPRDKLEVSNNTVLSIVFVVLVAMIGWVKIDQNGLRQELNHRIDKLESKIDANHKQILDILLKRK